MKLSPSFLEYFRTHRPPTQLIIWGKHDPDLIPAGAAASRRDNPQATVKLLHDGHFALERRLLTPR